MKLFRFLLFITFYIITGTPVSASSSVNTLKSAKNSQVLNKQKVKNNNLSKDDEEQKYLKLIEYIYFNANI